MGGIDKFDMMCSVYKPTLRSRRWHCVKSVRLRSFSCPHFPAFGLNTETYRVNLRIQSKCGKIWTRKTQKLLIELRVEKLNIVSNDQGSTQKCIFFVLNRKYPFSANLVQKIKIVSFS